MARPLYQRVGDGWVILRQQAVGHHCRPPCTDSVAIENRIELWDYGHEYEQGDQWLCECGRAWVIRNKPPGELRGIWHRNPDDDLTPVE